MKNNIFLHDIFYYNAYFYAVLGLYLRYLGFLAYGPLLKFTQYKKCFPMIYYKSDFERKKTHRTGKGVHMGQKNP